MNRKKFLLQLLPGLIPLFIFIIADEIWGTKIGLIIAIISGFVELVFYWFKYKKFDKFILFDTLLIVALGIVSIIVDNDAFFKIKPALIGLLICIILFISAFTPENIIFNISKRYFRGAEFSQIQYDSLKKSLKILFFLFLTYTALVFYSVWFMSKEAWAFISGGLFYIIFGAYFLFEIIRNKFRNKKLKNEEILPLVNENAEIIGKAPRSVCHSNKKYLHPVVHLHIINDKNEIFLQKRANSKKIQPNKWDTAVGGHVEFGEPIDISLKREAYEELGIKFFSAQLFDKYIWSSDIETEFVFAFLTRYNGNIIINKNEISSGKFWKINNIERNIDKKIFTPNFVNEFEKLKVVLSKMK